MGEEGAVREKHHTGDFRKDNRRRHAFKGSVPGEECNGQMSRILDREINSSKETYRRALVVLQCSPQ